jgi:hypothetical protein
VRVDPAGEYVAWSAYQADATTKVLLKSTYASAADLPALLGSQFDEAYFCDWTEQGDLLVNRRIGSRWALAVINKDGALLREIPTIVDVPDGAIASWRKYEHH